LLLVVPVAWRLPVFVVMAVAELAVPVRGRTRTTDPPGTRIISPNAMDSSRSSFSATRCSPRHSPSKLLSTRAGQPWALISVAFCGLLGVLSMWWLYFGQRAERVLRSTVAAVATPVAVFVLCVGLVHVRPHRPGRLITVVYPVTTLFVLASVFTPVAVPLTAALIAALVAASVVAGGA